MSTPEQSREPVAEGGAAADGKGPGAPSELPTALADAAVRAQEPSTGSAQPARRTE